MQLSNAPSKIRLPFANSGTKNTVPVASQIGITAGAASYTDGFPPLTFTPVASGGVPPFGADFNGVFNAATAIERWYSAGAGFVYDSAFAGDSNVGGYPKGARVLRSDGLGYWLNIADNNTTNPESGGSNWVPDYAYGVAAITMTGSNVTLTALQYGQPIINITGTLTANVQLLFPDGIAGQWAVINNTSGSFSITAKTVSGAGFSIFSGITSIVGDGVNLYSAQNSNQASISGAYKNLSASSTGTDALVTVSVDEIVLANPSNQCITARAVSLPSISLASSGANGLDTGTSSASTWYAVWVISNGTSTAGLLSLSATSPTMPAGYTYKARIGWIRSDGTANKYPLSFVQKWRRVAYKVGSGTNVANLRIMSSGANGDAGIPTFVAVGTSNFVPPTASMIDVILRTGNNTSALCAPNNNYGGNGSLSNPSPLSGIFASGTFAVTTSRLMTLESSNIYWASSGTGSTDNLIACAGWQDNI